MELKQISKDLNLSEEEVIAKGVKTLLDRELKDAYVEINKFKLKYQVISPKELEQKIENKEAAEHPGWEDAIEWENLQKRVSQVRKWIQKASTAS